MGRNVYKDWDTWDAKVEGQSIISQNVSICNVVHRLKYEIQEDRTYEKSTYAL